MKQRLGKSGARLNAEAELDITSFMNLMIILVPVLLMSMVFAKTTVLDLQLSPPGHAGAATVENRQLEVLIRPAALVVNYPAGVKVKEISSIEGVHDLMSLQLTLKEIKQRLAQEGLEKRDIQILAAPDTDYQTIVSVMDTVRSWPAVVAASVVDAVLFPDVSLGDLPASGCLSLTGENSQC